MKRELKLQVLVFLSLLGLAFPHLTEADPIVYESGGRRDPLIPLLGPGGVQTTKISTDLQIEGIIYDPPIGSLVLINGDFYKQGQTAGEATIMSILKDRVILSQDDKEKILWIREEILQKGAKPNVEKAKSNAPH